MFLTYNEKYCHDNLNKLSYQKLLFVLTHLGAAVLRE